MIIWLASYPKSGNTWVRSLLSAYYYSKNGNFNFELLKNIDVYPQQKYFDVKIDKPGEINSYWDISQEKIISKKKIKILKTHNSLLELNGKNFTKPQYTLGIIYIVRDPRNVVTSFAKFSNCSTEEAVDLMINRSHFGGNLAAEKHLSERSKVWTGTWNNNYKSWKSFKSQQKYLLIKYEDLINNAEATFLQILEFIFKINKSKFLVEQDKLNNVLKTTTFDYMKNLEKQKGFIESKVNKKTNEKIPFFNSGPQNDWRQILNPKIKDIIEKTFKKEMLELGYL